MRPVSTVTRRRRILTLTLAVAVIALAIQKKRLELERVRRRRWYVRPINVSRPVRSEYHLLVDDFYHFDDTQGHRQYFRMDCDRLEDLFRRVREKLKHAGTHACPIPVELRFSMAIKVLASGDSLQNTAKTYRIGYKTAFKILYEVCDALWTVLQPDFLTLPSANEWRRIADTYWEKWNFPLCLGAIDGKHVKIKKPPEAGSGFFNYMMDHSLVLMAVADADYCFSYVDIGQYGRSSDGGVFRNSTFGRSLADNSTNCLQLPGPTALPGCNVVCPFVFVADAAFPIGGHLLKPYGGRHRSPKERLFDYRLSRARRTVENAFGIMAARWRILQQPIASTPDNAVRIVKAVCVLHNYLRKTEGNSTMAHGSYMPLYLIDHVDHETGDIREGLWRRGIPANGALIEIASTSLRNEIGNEIRRRITDYFITDEGSVPWQLSKFPDLSETG